MSRSSDADGCFGLLFGLMIAFVIVVVAFNSVLVPIFGDKGAKLVSVIAIGFGLLKWWGGAEGRREKEREDRRKEVEQAAREAELRRQKEKEDRQNAYEQAAREAELRRQKEKEDREEERRLKSFGFGNVGSLSGTEFELAIALYLRTVGFEKVETTPASGDFGADLLISHGRKKIVVQCKRWSATVGVTAVQEVHSAKSHYRANEAWVITSSTFTQPAKDLAKTTKVRLFDWQDIRADRIRPD